MHARCRRQVLPYPRSLSRLNFNFQGNPAVHNNNIRASSCLPSAKHQIETCEWNSISISISKDFAVYILLLWFQASKLALVGCRKSAEEEFAALATSLDIGVQSKKDRFLAPFWPRPITESNKRSLMQGTRKVHSILTLTIPNAQSESDMYTVLYVPALLFSSSWWENNSSS